MADTKTMKNAKWLNEKVSSAKYKVHKEKDR